MWKNSWNHFFVFTQKNSAIYEWYLFLFYRSIHKRLIRPLDFRISKKIIQDLALWIGQQTEQKFLYKVWCCANFKLFFKYNNASSFFLLRVECIEFHEKRPFILYSKLQRDYTISLKNCKLGLYQLKVHF